MPLGGPFAQALGPPSPNPLVPSQASSPILGLDQDWSAIAATQCRLDKEGATKLVCDLITSTKNEKIFQESIGLAIRLLDGGNTEIQVWSGWLWSARGSPPLGGCLLFRKETVCQVSKAVGAWLPGWVLAASTILLPVGGSNSHIFPVSRGYFSIHTHPSLIQPGLSLSPYHLACYSVHHSCLRLCSGLLPPFPHPPQHLLPS